MKPEINPLKYGSIRKWLTFRASSQTTRDSYISCMRHFLKITKVNPDKLIEDWRRVKHDPHKRQGFIDKVSKMTMDYFTYILERKNLAELSKKNRISVVKSFFNFYKIPLEVDDPVMKPCVTYHNRMITKEEIKKILEVSSPREKAFFIMMVETGLRPDTLVKLQYKHIKEEYEKGIVPMKIDLPKKLLKDRVGDRFTFLGHDGYQILKTYLDTRGKLKDDDYLFPKERRRGSLNEPLPPTTFSNAFRKTALKLKLIENYVKGKPLPLRLYCLRKYFRNNCRLDPSIREFFMGHSLGVDEHYISRDVELYRQLYAKAYEDLRVYEKPKTTLTLTAEEVRKLLPPDEIRRLVVDYFKTDEGRQLLINTITTLFRDSEKFKQLTGSITTV
ncbi:MAG: site-specific integrase [Candidatus Bathyarchaeota archaeon]|nr:site-specific integrase [Candidatus Bathyarchaeota archaeon]